jgi:O-antigen/teichoic acid export membrane protein
LSLRVATLFAKFALVLALAKYLPPADVGTYGLLFATIIFLLMALGFDFYTYAHRELIVSDKSRWAGLIRDQAVFYGFTYLALLPVCLLVFVAGLLPWNLAVWFLPLLALEHIAQEFNRLLVAMSQQGWASVVLFVRHGIWAIVAVLWMYFSPAQRSLEFVLLAWLVGLVLAVALGCFRLARLDRASLQADIDWSWIKRGIKVAVPFLVASLTLRALFTVDRYWMEALAGLDTLAAYVLFFGIANAVFSVVDATVVSFMYPRLVAATRQGEEGRFRHLLRALTWQVLLATSVFSVAALVCIHPLLQWLDKPVYTAGLPFFYWLLAATVFFCLSMIPHVGLYARRRDKAIVAAHILSLPVFASATVLLIPVLQAAAVPAGLAVAFLFLAVFKEICFLKSAPAAVPALS